MTPQNWTCRYGWNNPQIRKYCRLFSQCTGSKGQSKFRLRLAKIRKQFFFVWHYPQTKQTYPKQILLLVNINNSFPAE